MRIKMFESFVNEKFNNSIDFELLDTSKFSNKVSDLKSAGFNFKIIPTIYNYYNGKLLKAYGVTTTPADLIRYLRKSSTGTISPGFCVVIDANNSRSSELFKILADIQERNSDYKIDFKQESDGYHLDFVSKVEEELTW